MTSYYDPEARTVYLVRRNDPLLDRIAIVHGLAQALDDQAYDVRARLRAAGSDPDRNLATSALIEGSASLVVNHYLRRLLLVGVYRAPKSAQSPPAAEPYLFREMLLRPALLGRAPGGCSRG